MSIVRLRRDTIPERYHLSLILARSTEAPDQETLHANWLTDGENIQVNLNLRAHAPSALHAKASKRREKFGSDRTPVIGYQVLCSLGSLLPLLRTQKTKLYV